MTAKAIAILAPIAMPCVCKKCLSLNLKEFKDQSHEFSKVYMCCWDRFFVTDNALRNIDKQH